LATWTTIFLAFLQELFDFRLRRALAPFALRTVRRFVIAFQPLELLDRVDDVGDVQKAVALQADVNERALHAGQHFRHPALVDVPHHAALAARAR
jgi:hypothetical protein